MGVRRGCCDKETQGEINGLRNTDISPIVTAAVGAVGHPIPPSGLRCRFPSFLRRRWLLRAHRSLSGNCPWSKEAASCKLHPLQGSLLVRRTGRYGGQSPARLSQSRTTLKGHLAPELPAGPAEASHLTPLPFRFCSATGWCCP